MKRVIKYIFLQCSLLLFVFSTAYTQQSINSSVQSSAGGIIQGGTYTLNSTVGQPSPTGFLLGGNNILSAGYIPTLLTTPDIDNIAPSITHTAITSSPANQIILIQAEITDNVGVNLATLYFRKIGDTIFDNVVMTSTSNTFSGSIPSSSVQIPGVEYYIEATDDAENTARNPDQGVYSVSIADDFSPNITHTVVTSSPANQIIPVQAEITDNVGVTSANLFFRRGGDASFTSLVMLPTGDIFNGAIPANVAQLTGVEYYIEASDDAGNTARQPNQGVVAVQVSTAAGEGLQKTTAQPSGNSQNAYRLISIPLAADNRTPAAILADDLGTYDVNSWRLFSLQADQTYAEFPSAGAMDPGKAFWLIVKDAGKFIDTGPASSNLTNAPFAITLNAGWTFIGNPFNFSIPQSKLTLGNSGTLDIRTYTGVWNNYTGSLQPFEGYAVFSNTATTLSIDPQLTAPEMNKNLIASDSGFDWSIDIIASCQGAKDLDNKIAVSEDAEDGWDKFDRPEPPQIGEYVTVKFPHEEWEQISKSYCVDVRPSILEGDTWDFEVETNITDKVNISFDKVSEVPENFEVWLVDPLLKTTKNIRLSSNYVFNSKTDGKSKKLKLLVGNEDFIKKEFAEMQLFPTEFKLHQNFPNPFNPTTNIFFSIPSEEKVLLKIYNVLGKEVSTLLNEVKSAGTHAVTFDGKSLASGVYFYSIEAGTFSNTKKFILLK